MYDSLIFKLFYEHYTVIVSGDGGWGVGGGPKKSNFEMKKRNYPRMIIYK